MKNKKSMQRKSKVEKIGNSYPKLARMDRNSIQKLKKIIDNSSPKLVKRIKNIDNLFTKADIKDMVSAVIDGNN